MRDMGYKLSPALFIMLHGFFLSISDLRAQEIPAANETLLKIIVVYPAAGHSAVYLERGGQKMYWDPGGTYGSELEECLDTNNAEFQAYCERFLGFPWFELNQTRRHDVLLNEMADLTRVLSIYFLDGDSKIKVFTIKLNGEMGERAWNMIKNGARHGSRAKFKTDRLTLTCTKAVSGYLLELGDIFSGISKPWYPDALAKDLKRIGELEQTTYTMAHTEIQDYIKSVRKMKNLTPVATCRGVLLGAKKDSNNLILVNHRELCYLE